MNLCSTHDKDRAKPRSVKIKEAARQRMITRHGIDVVNAMDSIDDHYNEINYFKHMSIESNEYQ